MATGNDDGSIDRLTGLDGTGVLPTAMALAMGRPVSQHPFGINNQRQHLYQPSQQRLIGINGPPTITFGLPPTTATSGLSPTPMATFLPGSSMPPTSTQTQSILVPSAIGDHQSLQLALQALQPQQQQELSGQAEPSINATGDVTTVDSSNLLASATAQNQQPSPEFVCHLYAMVSDTSLCGDIISWVVPSHDETEPQGGGTKGKGKIVVHDPHRLQDEVLGRYYRHSKYSSFQRQMNYFGFKKRLHGSKKGKLSPCSYIHHCLSREPRSLLALKRRQASNNKRKSSAMGLDPNDPNKRQATHETNPEAGAGQYDETQLSTCMPLNAPVMTQAVRTLPLPLSSLPAFNQAQLDSVTPQDFVQAGNAQIPLMGPLNANPSQPALSLEVRKLLEENFTNAVKRLDASQAFERQGVPIAPQVVPTCLPSVTAQHQVQNPVPLPAFGSLPLNNLLPSGIVGALPSLLLPNKPCMPAQISTQAYTEVSSSASGRSISSDSPSSGADSTGIRTPPGLYAQQPALSAAGIPMNIAATLGGIQSQQINFTDLTTTLLSTALPPSDELFRDDDLSPDLIQLSSNGEMPLPGP